MTDTAPPDVRPPVVPEGKHWSNLTIGELGYAGRELGCDIIHAAGTDESPYRLEAFAWVAYLWARRTDPTVQVRQFMDLDPDELQHVLRLRQPAPAPPREGEDQSPTDSAHESSSLERGESTPTTS